MTGKIRADILGDASHSGVMSGWVAVGVFVGTGRWRVRWARASKREGAHWPSLPVRYEPIMPEGGIAARRHQSQPGACGSGAQQRSREQEAASHPAVNAGGAMRSAAMVRQAGRPKYQRTDDDDAAPGRDVRDGVVEELSADRLVHHVHAPYGHGGQKSQHNHKTHETRAPSDEPRKTTAAGRGFECPSMSVHTVGILSGGRPQASRSCSPPRGRSCGGNGAEPRSGLGHFGNFGLSQESEGRQVREEGWVGGSG